MKDLVNIQDFLVTPDELGDWEGDEEIVADKMNELLHYCWSLIPDDTDILLIEQILSSIWDNFRGDTVILDVDIDQLQDWVVTHIRTIQNTDK
ncbi:MAG: hypothetical protein HRT35_30505 [Algicola sp.]|nr:hypothetical protein [Algicola sp.]